MTATIHLVDFSAPGGDPVPPGILAYGPVKLTGTAARAQRVHLARVSGLVS